MSGVGGGSRTDSRFPACSVLTSTRCRRITEVGSHRNRLCLLAALSGRSRPAGIDAVVSGRIQNRILCLLLLSSARTMGRTVGPSTRVLRTCVEFGGSGRRSQGPGGKRLRRKAEGRQLSCHILGAGRLTTTPRFWQVIVQLSPSPGCFRGKSGTRVHDTRPACRHGAADGHRVYERPGRACSCPALAAASEGGCRGAECGRPPHGHWGAGGAWRLQRPVATVASSA